MPNSTHNLKKGPNRLLGKLLITTAIIGLSQGITHIAYAQSGGIDEIIVTAQKRSTNLQTTAIAITAVTSEALEARGVEDISSIAAIAPNVQFEGSAPLSGGSFNATVFIRGVGQNDASVFNDPGVGIYADGVYLGRTTGSILDIADIERVEVLRGPQGTLFGKNAVGGAINVISKRPTDETEASISATTGSYNRIDLKAMVSGPMGENLKGRFNIGYFNRDGYVKRILVGDDLGDKNMIGGKAIIVYEPSDRLSFDLALDGSIVDQNSAALTMLNVVDNPNATPGPFLGLFNALVAPGTGIIAPDGGNRLNASFITGDPFTTYATGPNRNDLKQYGLSLTSKYELSETLDAKFITAYRNLDAQFSRDGDNTPFAFRETEDDVQQYQFSQEIQLLGSNESGRLNYVLGGYYLQESAEDLARITLAEGIFAATNIGGLDIVFDQFVKVKTKSLAAFGQVTYDFTDRLGATVGLRYTEDTKTFEGFEHRIASGGFIFNEASLLALYGEYPLKETFDDISPLFRLEYDVSDNLFVYGSASKGFKSGSFNGRAVTGANEIEAFQPETVWNYEFGAKTDLFDRRLILSAAAFYMDYTDIQITVNRTPQNFVKNAAAAKIKGVELEFTALPTENLRIEGALGLLDAEYVEIGGALLASGFSLPITVDSLLVRTPDITANLGVSYTFEVGDNSDLVVRGDWRHTGKQAYDAANSPLITQGSYNLLSARVTYQDKDSDWSVAAFVTNLADEEYLISGNAGSGAFGFITEGSYGRPREWGITLKKNFR